MSRRIRSKTVTHGLNAENPKVPDDKYMECWNCGFVCNFKRDFNVVNGARTGDGITTVDGSYVDESGVTQYYGDPTVNSGCPLCGCQKWESK